MAIAAKIQLIIRSADSTPRSVQSLDFQLFLSSSLLPHEKFCLRSVSETLRQIFYYAVHVV